MGLSQVCHLNDTACFLSLPEDSESQVPLVHSFRCLWPVPCWSLCCHSILCSSAFGFFLLRSLRISIMVWAFSPFRAHCTGQVVGTAANAEQCDLIYVCLWWPHCQKMWEWIWCCNGSFNRGEFAVREPGVAVWCEQELCAWCFQWRLVCDSGTGVKAVGWDLPGAVPSPVERRKPFKSCKAVSDRWEGLVL